MRRSDFPKKFDMRFEKRISEQLTAMDIPHLTNCVLCLCCRCYFRNPTFGIYPQSCDKCGVVFDKPGQYIMPDVILPGGDGGISGAVIFVNGSIHQKTKVRARDKAQIAKLREFDMLAFVITNDEIDHLTNMNLRLYLQGVKLATIFRDVYGKARLGEKEIWGINE